MSLAATERITRVAVQVLVESDGLGRYEGDCPACRRQIVDTFAVQAAIAAPFIECAGQIARAERVDAYAAVNPDGRFIRVTVWAIGTEASIRAIRQAWREQSGLEPTEVEDGEMVSPSSVSPTAMPLECPIQNAMRDNLRAIGATALHTLGDIQYAWRQAS